MLMSTHQVASSLAIISLPGNISNTSRIKDNIQNMEASITDGESERQVYT